MVAGDRKLAVHRGNGAEAINDIGTSNAPHDQTTSPPRQDSCLDWRVFQADPGSCLQNKVPALALLGAQSQFYSCAAEQPEPSSAAVKSCPRNQLYF